MHDHVCLGVYANQDLIGRKIETRVWETPLFPGAAEPKESGLQRVPKVWGAALKVRAGTPLSVRCLRWVLLVGHSLSNSLCSFHLQPLCSTQHKLQRHLAA